MVDTGITEAKKEGSALRVIEQALSSHGGSGDFPERVSLKLALKGGWSGTLRESQQFPGHTI
jgi:hypothetical protein